MKTTIGKAFGMVEALRAGAGARAKHRSFLAKASGLAWLLAAAAAASGLFATAAAAELFKLKIASGNATGIEYIDSAHDYFVPELQRRVKERTAHSVEVTESYGGSLLKVSEVLDGTRSGAIDLGLLCVCHEGKRLRLNNFMFLAPFSLTDPVLALQATRAVYRQVPELPGIFDTAFNQTLIALMPLEPYDLLSTFALSDPKDLQGRKVSGSGPNFPWITALGASPVPTQGQHDHVSAKPPYDASVGFVSLATSLKLYEKGMTHFIQTGLGSQVILTLTVNNDALRRLPPDVRAILLETAADYERVVAERGRDRYEAHVREVADHGMKVSAFTLEQRRSWADMLVPWSAAEVKALDDTGAPAGRAIDLFVAAAETLGHRWPVQYRARH